MADHEDHGSVATHPLLLGVAAFAFLVLMVIGFQLWSSAGHTTDTDHGAEVSTPH